MLIKTFKIRRPKLWLGAIGIIAAAAVVFLLITGMRNSKVRELDTEPRRQAFLHEMGWDIPERFEQVKTIIVPEEWDEVYRSYNKLQKQQGFDLSTYAGETCTAYTYRVMNYEGSTDTVLAQLFVYRNRVIGGDIHATAMDGFMHGLR